MEGRRDYAYIVVVIRSSHDVGSRQRQECLSPSLFLVGVLPLEPLLLPRVRRRAHRRIRRERDRMRV